MLTLTYLLFRVMDNRRQVQAVDADDNDIEVEVAIEFIDAIADVVSHDLSRRPNVFSSNSSPFGDDRRSVCMRLTEKPAQFCKYKHLINAQDLEKNLKNLFVRQRSKLIRPTSESDVDRLRNRCFRSLLWLTGRASTRGLVQILSIGESSALRSRYCL